MSSNPLVPKAEEDSAATRKPLPRRRGGQETELGDVRLAIAMAGCCVFLRWPSTSPSRIGYRSLDDEADDSAAGPSPATVTVVVGKERRVFTVDQLVLDSYPFRVLLETIARKEERRGRPIFVDVDAILFEHILWLACDGRSVSQLLQLDLKEIIEFYSQDA
ncbi:uncharacterized protein LOC133911693 [Phragmites australis]|uniref:uncharacterized protein LOC133911693 n=1 Tax=Phragmites australis TaxID=29695 RepID=UPI002D770C02|nr:uncharacterized protein LOC133911693 [Phragmites australis]